MTAPGQTAAISVFTGPLVEELGISRSMLSASYLVGTLAGAVALPFVGRALDRFGVGRVMAVIGAVFGSVLMGLSFVTDIVGLTAGFVGIRMAGQGALGLAATTAVAVHVTRRRGFALGIKTAVGSTCISLAPVLLERLISQYGMSTTWRIEAVAVWAVVIPIALLIFGRGRRTVAVGPAEEGAEAADEAEDTAARTAPAEASWTSREAVRTLMFWVIAAGLATSGLLTTALNFHQIAALGEQGLDPTRAALNFLPQAAATMGVTLGVGALADRVAPKYGLVLAMLFLGGALSTLSVLDSGWTALLYGALLGAAGGTMMATEAAAYSHYFGTAHIGAIRGIATTISVASTALGPLVLSLGHGFVGSYGGAAQLLAVIPASVIVLALLVRPPVRRTDASVAVET
ncbi:MFS transporter [Georgenia halophila]|uniref:MFS transporter n=2 Tax=Georgenia halophila TaxID=620889 RepID=A0ABP8LGE3_9MICO